MHPYYAQATGVGKSHIAQTLDSAQVVDWVWLTRRIEPWAYLRDLLCLLPSWPINRVLELAPAFWQQTLQQEDAQQRLAANVFRGVTLVEQALST